MTQNTFVSRSILIRYTGEEASVRDSCCWRIEVPYEEMNDTSLVFSVDLYSQQPIKNENHVTAYSQNPTVVSSSIPSHLVHRVTDHHHSAREQRLRSQLHSPLLPAAGRVRVEGRALLLSRRSSLLPNTSLHFASTFCVRERRGACGDQRVPLRAVRGEFENGGSQQDGEGHRARVLEVAGRGVSVFGDELLSYCELFTRHLGTNRDGRQQLSPI